MKIEISTRFRINVVSRILKLLYSTNKYTVRGLESYEEIQKTGRSVIISVWHSQLLSFLYNLKDHEIHALAGTHRDAELISKIAIKWGWDMIRGSSKEDGSKAYKEILKVLNKPKNTLFITPDGPTGPPRVPKPGIIRAAQRTQTVILPTSAYSTKHWGFKNWDTFLLEKPFGEIFIEYGKPFLLDKNLTVEESSNLLVKNMKKTETDNLYYENKKK